MLDTVLRGGDVIDGTGSRRRRADVGILDGRVVAIGEIDESAHRTIDASGRVVSPGIVDVHTHLDAQLFWDSTLSPSPLHGVTTAFAGNCGFTIAPITAEAAAYLVPMLARVEGMPLDALTAGVACNWNTTEEFFEQVVLQQPAINVGFMVGHSAMRSVVMGEDANQRAATSDEIDSMVQLLRAGLTAGGMGFTSTWSAAHSDADGNPVPSRLANEDELIRLASVCRDFAGTSLEFLPRTSGNTPFEPDEIDLLTAMSRAGRRPLNWNLLRVEADNHVVEERLSLGTHSMEHGGRVIALCLPEPLELYMSFDTGAVLDTFAGWEPTMRLPLPQRKAALADPEVRRRLETDAASDVKRVKWTSWSTHVIVETFTPETKPYEGMTVGEIARRCDKRPFDALLDIVIADDLRTTYRNGTDHESSAIWESRAEVCRDRRAMIGGSDAGAHLDTISTHAYSSRALANLVRRHGVMTLEEAVHLVTGVPSALYGLRDRGVLAAGKAADVMVFDEETIDATPVMTKRDLPAGAGRLSAEAAGIDYVLVNGEVIAERGEFTDARPGRLLRSGVDTYTPAMN